MAVVAVAGCQGEPRAPCPAFDEAQAVFDELTATILDTEFQDPRFVRAAELFEAVPIDCPRRATGMAIARSIRDGQTSRRAASPPAPVPSPSPPVSRPLSRTVPPVPPPGGGREPTLSPRCRQFKTIALDVCIRDCKRSVKSGSETCRQRCQGVLADSMRKVGCPTPVRPAGSIASPRADRPTAAAPENSGRRPAGRARSSLSSAAAPPPPAPAAPPPSTGKWVYCAYFLPSGNHKKSHCSRAALSEAQALCDQELSKQGIEGSCACTDDAGFIGDRCR